MTLQTFTNAMEKAKNLLQLAGIHEPQREARLLLSYVTGLPMSRIFTNPDTELNSVEHKAFDGLVSRRLNHEPISHLLGTREFWSLNFLVGAQVLDPRPASETLVETAFKYFNDQNASFSVLDLGTGSGCLVLSVLSERPHAGGLGIDVSSAALGIARQNAILQSLSERVSFKYGDWAKNLYGEFDLILCNPPYIAAHEMNNLASGIINFEPSISLFGGVDGLSAYRKLSDDIAKLLSPKGIAIIECGQGQSESVNQILKKAGLTQIDTNKDISGITRCGVFSKILTTTK